MTWTPEQYVRGNYFQNAVNELFRKNFRVQPFGAILDIGCGDGQYTHFLADKLKQGYILGIDSSADMIEHATQRWAGKNLVFAHEDIEDFVVTGGFDFALSFWCLHWTDIELSLPCAFHALKKGGRMYAVLSSFSDNSIMQAWHELEQQKRYADLAAERILAGSKRKDFFFHVLNTLNQLPFREVRLHLKTVRIQLPEPGYFKNLLLALPFIKTLPTEQADSLLDALVWAFERICQRQYGGKLYYETRPIFLEALK